MEKKIFYIYEVKGIKNGCTTQWDIRSEQNFKKYNIMPVIVETHEYPNTAEYWQILGDREWELANLNGYPKGNHYRVAMEARSVGRKTGCSKGGKTQGPISGKMAVESGQLASIRGMGGKVSGKIVGKKNVESGHISALGKSSRKLTYEDAQLIRKLCVKKQYKQKELAKMYCVTPMVISLIINNKTYINQ